MRYPVRITVRLTLAMLLASVVGLPVFAGQSAQQLDLSSGAVPGRQAETGKPAIAAAPGLGATQECAAPLPCGTWLFGTVRKNGVVEFQVPALRW